MYQASNIVNLTDWSILLEQAIYVKITTTS